MSLDELGTRTLQGLVSELEQENARLRHLSSVAEQETVSVGWAAKELGVATDKVRCLMRHSHLVSVRVKDEWRIPLAELRRFIDDHRDGLPQPCDKQEKLTAQRLLEFFASAKR